MWGATFPPSFYCQQGEEEEENIEYQTIEECKTRRLGVSVMVYRSAIFDFQWRAVCIQKLVSQPATGQTSFTPGSRETSAMLGNF